MDGTVTADTAKGGAHRHALCVGLNAVLGGYHAAVTDVEQELLRDASLPMSHIRYKLREVRMLDACAPLCLARADALTCGVSTSCCSRRCTASCKSSTPSDCTAARFSTAWSSTRRRVCLSSSHVFASATRPLL